MLCTDVESCWQKQNIPLPPWSYGVLFIEAVREFSHAGKVSREALLIIPLMLLQEKLTLLMDITQISIKLETTQFRVSRRFYTFVITHF